MAKVSPARNAAFRILLAVESGHAHSDDLLRTPAVSALAPVDRNLTTALVLGVLRWQLQLDAALRPLLSRPNAKLDPEVLIALRLGAFQLLRMDRIPARAAIDESVQLAKQSGHRFASGMVNAVLRKLADSKRSAEEDAEGTVFTPIHKEGDLKGTGFSPYIDSAKSKGALAPEIAAYPAWLAERWTNQFGPDSTCSICRYGQSQPALTIRIVDPAAESELLHAGIQLEPAELLTSARTVLAGDVTTTAALREGRIRIQGEGSQLIAEIAGQADTILDSCAAPGGKTLLLAERNPHAHIVACESSAPRLAALRERLAPFGNRIEYRHADAATLADADAYDLVLADVPCSGTGTLGRNPEIRHRLAAADVLRHAELQRAILNAGIRAARPGGRILYSTCSLEPEENEQVIAAALADHTNVRVLPLIARLDAMRNAGILAPGAAEKLQSALIPEGYLRLIPGVFATDGFFIAALERIR